MGRNYRDESRRQYTAREEKSFTLEQLNTGCLMRAADALERIAPAAELAAKRFADLVEEAARERNRRVAAEGALMTERKRTAALRGHLKRAKMALSTAKTDGIATAVDLLDN